MEILDNGSPDNGKSSGASFVTNCLPSCWNRSSYCVNYTSFGLIRNRIPATFVRMRKWRARHSWHFDWHKPRPYRRVSFVIQLQVSLTRCLFRFHYITGLTTRDTVLKVMTAYLVVDTLRITFWNPIPNEVYLTQPGCTTVHWHKRSMTRVCVRIHATPLFARRYLSWCAIQWEQGMGERLVHFYCAHYFCTAPNDFFHRTAIAYR